MSRKCPPGCKCGKHTHILRTSYEKECRECGATFTAKRIDAQFCTVDCHHRFWGREHQEEQRAASARWMRENRERRKEIVARSDAKHGERRRAEHRERYAEVSADPDKAAARQAASHQYYLDNREHILATAKKRRAQDLTNKYLHQHGVPWEPLFQALWEAQDGRCYLCRDELRRDEPKAIHLDHDHSCCPLARSCERCRRGLACKDCNHLIGVAKDDPDRLRRIADNLERAVEGVRERMQEPRQPRIDHSWELSCEFCGKSFRGCRSDIQCCSSSCYYKLRYRRRAEALKTGEGTASCKRCGEPFIPRTAQNVYCSKNCSNAAYVDRKH
jgi:hypothetical protein